MEYLEERGYTLLKRNHRTRHGEIDLVMCDEEILVFVEVKLRRGTEFGHPLEAVTQQKQARIRLMAEHCLAEEEFASGFEEVRFDVIGILLAAGKIEIRHVEDAF